MVYGYFSYPEIFSWVSFGGILALLFPFIAIFLGLGFLYASFSKERVPPLAPKSSFHLDERIDIEGAKHVDKETSTCKQHLVPGEKLLAIILGEVEGKPELDRLALTDRRILFYSANKSRDALKFDYGQVASFDAKKGKVLQHLGEINLFVEGESIRFKNVLEEYLEQILNTISKMKKKAAEAKPAPNSFSLQQEMKKFCGNCGKPVEPGDKFCGNCGEKLT